MNSTTLQLPGATYTLSDLPEINNPLSFYDRVIEFCQRWISGQTFFEIQTSGSTGTPKNIVISRKSMEESARGTIRALALQPYQTSLVCLDPTHIAGMMMLVRSLINEMHIIAVEPCANPFDKLSPTSKVDFTALVPYQIKSILSSLQRDSFSKEMSVLIGGAPLDYSTKELLQNYTTQFFETYGMTETISHIALKPLNGARKSNFFTTLPHVTVRQDERGCLCIRTTYLENEIVTNDIVEMVDINQFIWLGRWDNVINSGGLKIFPETIEQKLEEVFSVLEFKNTFFIAGQPDEKWGQAVHLFVEGSLAEEKIQDLNDTMKNRLHKFEVPKSIHFLPNFVRTNSSKVNRVKTVSLLNERK